MEHTRKSSTTILLFIILIAQIFTPLSASGQESEEEKLSVSPRLTLAPSIVEDDANRNGTIEHQITISTNSLKPIPITIKAIDYTVDLNGYPTFETDSSRWSAKTWITTDPSDFILLTNEPRTVTVTTNVPEFAEYGSHVATLLFQPVLPPEYFDPHSAHVIPYVGAIIAINIIDPQGKPNLDYLTVTRFNPKISPQNTVSLDATIHNRDVYYHKVNGRLEFTNLLNLYQNKLVFEGITVMPRTEREISKTFAKKLENGIYWATLQVFDENDQFSISRPFINLSGAQILSIFLLIAFLGISIIKRNRLIRNITLIKQTLASRLKFTRAPSLR